MHSTLVTLLTPAIRRAGYSDWDAMDIKTDI